MSLLVTAMHTAGDGIRLVSDVGYVSFWGGDGGRGGGVWGVVRAVQVDTHHHQHHLIF